MRINWATDRFCVFCAKTTKAYYICQGCLEEKAKIVSENMEKIKDVKRRKGAVYSLKCFRHSLLIHILALGSVILLVAVCMFPPIWKVVRNRALELQVLIILPFYLSTFTGMYLGLKIYSKFIKSPLSLPRIFYKGYQDYKIDNLLSKISFILEILLDTYKRPFLLLGRLLPLILPALIFLFFPSQVFGFLKDLPIPPFIRVNLPVWLLALSTNFYIGLLFIGPFLWDFLYTDWVPLIVEKIKEGYAQAQ